MASSGIAPSSCQGTFRARSTNPSATNGWPRRITQPPKKRKRLLIKRKLDQTTPYEFEMKHHEKQFNEKHTIITRSPTPKNHQKSISQTLSPALHFSQLNCYRKWPTTTAWMTCSRTVWRTPTPTSCPSTSSTPWLRPDPRDPQTRKSQWRKPLEDEFFPVALWCVMVKCFFELHFPGTSIDI